MQAYQIKWSYVMTKAVNHQTVGIDTSYVTLMICFRLKSLRQGRKRG